MVPQQLRCRRVASPSGPLTRRTLFSWHPGCVWGATAVSAPSHPSPRPPPRPSPPLSSSLARPTPPPIGDPPGASWATASGRLTPPLRTSPPTFRARSSPSARSRRSSRSASRRRRRPPPPPPTRRGSCRARTASYTFVTRPRCSLPGGGRRPRRQPRADGAYVAGGGRRGALPVRRGGGVGGSVAHTAWTAARAQRGGWRGRGTGPTDAGAAVRAAARGPPPQWRPPGRATNKTQLFPPAAARWSDRGAPRPAAQKPYPPRLPPSYRRSPPYT